jgi:hypothetical protein
MTMTWTPDPCTGDAQWTGLTVCTRPYGHDGSSYGRGPYGRCAIIGNALWTPEMACAPFSAQAPLPPNPWKRRRGR